MYHKTEEFKKIIDLLGPCSLSYISDGVLEVLTEDERVCLGKLNELAQSLWLAKDSIQVKSDFGRTQTILINLKGDSW